MNSYNTELIRLEELHSKLLEASSLTEDEYTHICLVQALQLVSDAIMQLG